MSREDRIIESHRLSSGQLVQVSKSPVGRTYTYLLTDPDEWAAPLIICGLTKAKALDYLAESLRADVLDLD